MSNWIKVDQSEWLNLENFVKLRITPYFTEKKSSYEIKGIDIQNNLSVIASSFKTRYEAEKYLDSIMETYHGQKN